jgi:hypothetical protein
MNRYDMTEDTYSTVLRFLRDAYGGGGGGGAVCWKILREPDRRLSMGQLANKPATAD